MDFKKIPVFCGIGLIVIASGANTACNFFNKSHSDDSEEASDEHPPEKPAASEAAPKAPPPAASNNDVGFVEETTPVTLTNIVNMPGSKGGFLKCQISIMVIDEELGKKMNAEAPSPENAVAKAIVLDALSSMTEEDIFDNEARQVLRENITEKLNERIRLKPSTEKKAPPRPARPFKDVLITEWAVQR